MSINKHSLFAPFALIIVISLFSLSFSCGFTTHIQIANRAKEFFSKNITSNTQSPYQFYSDLLNKHPSYYEAGASFPDWGYPFGYDDAAEFTHWPPFLKSMIEYINKTYQKNSTKYEELLVFTFGISSHGIADVLWHWGKTLNHTSFDQGFIPSLKHYSGYCHDDNDNCHDVADTGADGYLQYRSHLTVYSKTWNVPVSDLVNVYAENGYSVSELKLEGIVLLIYIASYGEKEYAYIKWEEYERKSPFIAENLDAYYHGGGDDMAIHSAMEFLNVIKGVENDKGNGYEGLGFSEIFVDEVGDHEGDSRHSDEYSSGRVEEINMKINTLINYYPKGSIRYSKVDGELRIEINEREIHDAMRVKFRKQQQEEKEKETQDGKSRDGNTRNYDIISSPYPLSYFGSSIALFTIKHLSSNGGETLINNIAVGAYGHQPGQTGAVYLYQYLSDSLHNDTPHSLNFTTPLLTGEAPYSKFGHQIATVDINHDGCDDFVVAAPTFGTNYLKTPVTNSPHDDNYFMKDYTGKIYIFLGKVNSGVDTNAKPDFEIRLRNINEDIFMNLGLVIEGRDCNGDGFKDLLIGSPYAQSGGDKRGSAAVFLNIPEIRERSSENNTTEIIYLDQANIFIQGENDFGEFGSSINCDGNVLIIGEPGYRSQKQNSTDLNISSGAIHGYKVTDLSNTPLFTISNTQGDERFGSKIEIEYPLVVVGAPNHCSEGGYDQGKVVIYDITGLNGVYNANNNITTGCIVGEQNRGRFGKSLALKNNILFVGAPFYSSWTTNELGRIYQFNISNKAGEINAKDADYVYDSPVNEPARFGEVIRVFEKQDALGEGYLAASAVMNLDNLNSGNVVFMKVDI